MNNNINIFDASPQNGNILSKYQAPGWEEKSYLPKIITQNMDYGKYDSLILTAVLFLVGIGIIMVYSAGSAIAIKNYGSEYFFLRKQFIFSLMGGIVMIVFRNIPYQWYQRLAYPCLIISLLLLISIFLPGVGHKAGGAIRWIKFQGLSFQPSEIARFTLIIYLAYSLDKKKDRLMQFSIGIIPHAVIVGIFLIMIAMQPDFGSVVIIATLTFLMMFAGGVPIRHLFGCLLIFIPTAYYLVINAPYRLQRILTFLNPWQYRTEAGYQIIHSLMAFGSGGFWGAGLGKSYQKLFYLPEPHTDFIFSVIGEELGLIGVLVILTLYGLIIWRGFYIAFYINDIFASCLALGFTMAVALQVCVNISVTLGLLPTKGLTLPFLSYGGTSLICNMAVMGILMNISAHVKSNENPLPIKNEQIY
ncbi:stage V sporulation protein E [Candidatus Magnetomorum sp. HK-1]|nr:stage V sporulation protein E [Candidatus Magnetomorum sp. HK-1]